MSETDDSSAETTTEQRRRLLLTDDDQTATATFTASDGRHRLDNSLAGIVASSELDVRFLATRARCIAVWALSLAAVIPALTSSLRQLGGSWLAVGLVLLSLALGAIPGPFLAARLADVLHPQTVVMATAAVTAACWALAATGPTWPVLAMVALLAAAATSTFAFDTAHYSNSLAGPSLRGLDVASVAYIAAGIGVVCGLVVSLILGPLLVEAFAAAAMALLSLFAVAANSLRYDPFAD